MTATIVEFGSLVFPAGLLWAMYTDIRRFEIPNAIPALLTVAWAVLAIIGGWPWADWLMQLGFAILVLGCGIALTALRVIGGGDAKLVAAVAAWTGTAQFVIFLFYMALAGGILALLLVLFRRWRIGPPLERLQWLRNLHLRTKDVPYALAIGIAGLLVFDDLPLSAP